MNFLYFFFFFSSRRRHTRCLSDWSSDVCSSDLTTYSRKTSQKLSRCSAGTAQIGNCDAGESLQGDRSGCQATAGGAPALQFSNLLETRTRRLKVNEQRLIKLCAESPLTG